MCDITLIRERGLVRRILILFAVLSASAAFSVGTAVGEFNSFDRQADLDDNFTAFGPVEDLANNFTDVGWKDSNMAGGASGGEFGGTFARSPDRISYYDIAEQPWTMADPLSFSAKFFASNINFDGGIHMGFASINEFTGEEFDRFGWWLLEGNPFRSGIEVFFNETGADDSNLLDIGGEQGQLVSVPHDTLLQIDWEYTPTGGDFGEGEVHYTLTDVGDANNAFVLDEKFWSLHFGARNSGIELNAFGWASGSAEDVGQKMLAYWDDVCYGTNPECGGGPIFVPLAGDANGDKQVNTDDIVQILAAGKYETGQPATFAEGDFDGDGFFASGDILAMLAEDLYETGPYAASLAAGGTYGPDVKLNYIPEPSTILLLALGLIGLLHCGRRQR